MREMKKDNNNISWSLLAKDVSGELSSDEHLLLQKELAKNPDIEKQVKKLWGDARYAQELESIDTNKAWAKVKNEMSSNQSTSRLKIYSSIAAVFALVLASTWFFNIFSDKSTAVISTSHELQQVILPDGSSVDLNHGSTIKFAKNFTGEYRKVKLSGEAFFDVVRNEEKPFVIETEKLNIQVLGTSFNVKAYKGAHSSEVTVSSGKVSVNTLSGAEKVMLEAGDAVNYSTASNSLDIHKVHTANYKAWKTKEIEFDNNSLSEIIVILEDTYHIKIELEQGIVSDNMVLDATFSQHSLEHVLESVCSSLNLDYTITEGVYRIHNN